VTPLATKTTDSPGPEHGADAIWPSTDTLAPGSKNPSPIKSYWYGPDWWQAPQDGGVQIHDQDMIPETAGQRQYKLATMIVTGIMAVFTILEADFGEGEHCFSPVSILSLKTHPHLYVTENCIFGLTILPSCISCFPTASKAV